MFGFRRYVLVFYIFSHVFRFGFSYNQFSFVRPPSDELHKVGNVELGFEFSDEEMKKLKIWPGGIIPYFIDEFSFDKGSRDKIRLTLENMDAYTGLQFQELPSPPSNESMRWVLFINRIGQLACVDYNTKSFTNTGVQRVVLGYDCLGAGGGALAATVLALAGVPPQHNAPDRDGYIQVLTENIIPDKLDLFEALNNKEWLFHEVPYDYLSAGHYSFYKYTKNGRLSIKPKQNISAPIGEADFFSFKDILKIKLLYNFLRKTKKKKNINDCSRMFKPGKKFSDFNPEQSMELPASKKPHVYLHHSHESLHHRKPATVKYSQELNVYRPLRKPKS